MIDVYSEAFVVERQDAQGYATGKSLSRHDTRADAYNWGREHLGGENYDRHNGWRITRVAYRALAPSA